MKKLSFLLLCIILCNACNKKDCSENTGDVTYPYTKTFHGHYTYWSRHMDLSSMITADTVTGALDTTSSISFLSADSCTLMWITGELKAQSGHPVFGGVSLGPLPAHYLSTGFKIHSQDGHYAWEAQFRGDSLLLVTTDTANGIDSYFRSYETFSGRIQ
jgi:hypothetical protein